MLFPNTHSVKLCYVTSRPTGQRSIHLIPISALTRESGGFTGKGQKRHMYNYSSLAMASHNLPISSLGTS